MACNCHQPSRLRRPHKYSAAGAETGEWRRLRHSSVWSPTDCCCAAAATADAGGGGRVGAEPTVEAGRRKAASVRLAAERHWASRATTAPGASRRR